MQERAGERSAIRLLSYNVLYAGIESTPEWAWQHRRESVVSTLRFHRPDVIALQECWRDQLADIRSRLDGYEWYGERVAGGEHTPVGYRTDRFERESAGVFAVSETPADLGSTDWGAEYPRFATHLRLTDCRSGDEFLVLNTHLDHESERARLEGVRLLADWLSDQAVETMVVAGDFNCPPGSPPYEHLTTETPLADARTVATTPHHGPDVTWVNASSHDADEDPVRIDHIFVSPATDVERTGVCTDADETGRHPSDHLPVVADFVPRP